MKTNLLRTFMLCFLLTCLFGCEKEIDVIPERTSLDAETVHAIKTYLDEKAIDYVGAKRNNYESLLLSLDWKNASIAIEPDSKYLIKVSASMEMPVSKPGKRSKRQLVISMSGVEIHQAYVLDIIAADAFQHHITNGYRSESSESITYPLGFSGEIISYDLGLRMQERQYFKNGILSQRDVLKVEYKGGVGTQGGDTQIQQCTAWYLYTTYYYSDGTSSTEKMYLGTTCEGGYECMPYVISGDGEAIGVNCGGGGGGGGGYEEPAPVEVITDQTILNDPKANCIYKKLGQGNHAYDKFLKQFQSSTNYNVTFKLAPDLNVGGKPVNGFTEYRIGNSNVTIYINSSTMYRPSFEVAGTFVHEMAHAYLAQKLISVGGPGNLQHYTTDTEFKDLFDYYAKHVNPETGAYSAAGNSAAHHNLMAEKLIMDLAYGIKDFVELNTPDIRNYTDISIANYKAAAWNGLRDTDAFKKLSQADKDTIQGMVQLLQISTINGCN